MNKINFTLGFFFIILFTNAQYQTLHWAKNIGGPNYDNGLAIATDASGNVYTTGDFTDSADFDPGVGVFKLISSGMQDIFISKLDPNGNFSWAKRIGAGSVDKGTSIATDENNNVYIIGTFYMSVDFDPGPGTFNLTASGGASTFILKLDPSGNFIWARQISALSNSSSVYGSHISINNNTIYITGLFQGNADFDPGTSTFNLSSVGATDIFIFKADTSANLIWAKKIGGKSSEVGNAVKVDFNKNVYVAGSFSDTVDFDPGGNVYNLISAGGTDIFFLKSDSNGNFIWAKRMGGTLADNATMFAFDSLYNIYSTGVFEGTADFDPGINNFNLTSAGLNDIFVSKLDSSGNFKWAKKMGGSNYDYGISIACDKSGYVYTTGAIRDSADFDPGAGIVMLNYLTGGVFLQKLDSLGNFVSARNYGGASGIASSISLDSSYNIYISGNFATISDFDPGPGIYNLPFIGYNDIFIQKLRPCFATSSTINVSGCNSVISPSGKFKWTLSNTYTDTIANNKLCDSIITVNLILNKSFSTFNATGCNSYVSPSGKYKWYFSNIYNDTIINTKGCDSIITINLTLNKSFSTLNLTACNKYISPSGKYIWTLSNTYRDTILNTKGCDSIMVINLTLNKTFSTISRTGCTYFTSPSGKYIWTISNTYKDTILNSKGCDSVITINLTLNSTKATLFLSVCDSLISPSGKYIWKTSNLFRDTIPNRAGCDSILTMFLTVLKSSSNINRTACNSYKSPSGKYIWTSTNIYKDTLQNSKGCDSVITINLIINNSSSSIINPVICNSYKAPSGKYIWTSTNTYKDTIPNYMSCDSIITINLTVNNSSSSTINPTVCKSYTSPSGKHIWMNANTYKDTIPGAKGCDSIITINLSINKIDTSVMKNGATLSSNISGATYQWLSCNNGFSAVNGATNQSYTPVTMGNFAVKITKNSCTDTSSCHAISSLGITQNNFLSQVNLFPNPTDEKFTLDLGTIYENVKITITDLVGNKITEEFLSKGQLISLQIQTSSGVYFIRIQTNEQNTTLKLIKK